MFFLFQYIYSFNFWSKNLNYDYDQMCFSAGWHFVSFLAFLKKKKKLILRLSLPQFLKLASNLLCSPD